MNLELECNEIKFLITLSLNNLMGEEWMSAKNQEET